MMLDALNLKRKDHIVNELTLDTTVAPTLYSKVTKSTQGWGAALLRPSDVTLPAGGKYREIWFYDKDAAALFSSAKAVTGWYDGGIKKGSENYL
jgi:hypothetical protein